MKHNVLAEFIAASPAQTDRFGRMLGSLCLPGDVICLKGDLGTGKTTLTQSIARGAGVDQNDYVPSPRFAVFHEYLGRLKLYHMDFYRLNGSDDVIAMGLEEYFYLDGVSIIEWYQKAPDIIPPEHLLVELEIVDEQSRKIRCSSNIKNWAQRIKTCMSAFEPVSDPSTIRGQNR